KSTTTAAKTTAKKSASTTKTAASKTSSNATTTGRKVKAKKSAAEGLKDLFEDSMKDIYWAEKALVKALPKMAKNASSETLATAIMDHLAVTEEQVARLEK